MLPVVGRFARLRTRDSRREHHKVRRVAHIAAQRNGQVLHLFRGNDGIDVRSLRLNLGRIRRNRDGLLDLARLQRYGNRDGASNPDDNVLLEFVLKPEDAVVKV